MARSAQVPLDVHRWSPYPQARDAAEQLMKEFDDLAGKTLRQRKRFKKHLKVVLVDLYSGYLLDETLYIGFSRNHNSYGEAQRYNRLHIKRTNLIRIIDALFDRGYIEGPVSNGKLKGFRDRRPGGRSRQARMRATGKLIGLFHKCLFLPEMVKRIETEVIILKDEKKKKIDYDETSETERMRNMVRMYNEMILRHKIGLNPLAFKVLKPLKKKLNLSRVCLHRIFNNGSFEQGGRFYGGWWQIIINDKKTNSTYRRYVTIDGKDTVEFDFKALHAKMLYAKTGIDYKDDPYNILGPEYRDLMKFVLLNVLNASSEDEAVKSIQYEINMHKGKDDNRYPEVKNLREIVKCFISEHAAIQGFFGSGVGTCLQYLDSQIAEQVLSTFAEKDIVVLPVHDSFICQKGYENEVKIVMQHAYKQFIGEEFMCEITIK
jgi:hypothetical protein